METVNQVTAFVVAVGVVSFLVCRALDKARASWTTLYG